MPFPHFQITLTSPFSPNNGYVTYCNEKVHHINDVKELCKALGYNDEIARTGLTADEYLWTEYRKDNANKSDVCLQVKLIDYLSKHSSIFKQKYAAQCEHWLKSCSDKQIANASRCEECNMQPGKIKPVSE